MNEEQLIADLILDEGLRKKVYKCPAGKNTIAVGRNLDDVPLTPEEERHIGYTTAELIAGQELTTEQCLYLLRNDITRCKRELDNKAAWWSAMPEQAQRGLCNQLFNMGWGKLSGFKNMLASLKAGKYAEAADHAQDSAWFKQVGQRGPRVCGLYREAQGHPFA